MLVYHATKGQFLSDVETDAIVDHIKDEFERRLHRANPREVRAWKNSMQYMFKVLTTPDIPSDCGVAIEFGVPYTSSRIDFLLTGTNTSSDAAVIIELKQWESLEKVDGHDGVIKVRTFVGGGNRETTHPSYQAWSYSRMIQDYNESVREHRVELAPCAYLHNYRIAKDYDPLLDPEYLAYLEKAPVFCSGDVLRLREFICRYISVGDDGRVLYDIENGKLKPSKSLQDALTGMLEGNQEFVLIDDQKVVFEQACTLARRAQKTGKRQVMIVRGGPGTGKSVVAVNLLVALTAEELVVQYVSKNSAPRNVYAKLLQGGRYSQAFIKNLFRGPGKFYEHTGAPIDVVVIDEAHRLNAKSGLYGNEGENQIKEIITASRCSIFFIDESQRVTLRDIGTVAGIELFAEKCGAQVTQTELASQFRCNGSDDYLDWIDGVLGLRETEQRIGDLDFDFRVFDDPNLMAAAIEAENERSNRARMVAGYCWEWDSKKRDNPYHHDIIIEEHDFARSWNLSGTSTWAIDPDSVEQVGCVHTCQGLEFDYVGVIIGDDMRCEDGRVVTHYTKRAKSDASLKGIKALAKTDSERAEKHADELIRNTYRVLMTRGMKGCFVYCTDSSLCAYLRSQLPRRSGQTYELPAQEPILAAEDALGA